MELEKERDCNAAGGHNDVVYSAVNLSPVSRFLSSFHPLPFPLPSPLKRLSSSSLLPSFPCVNCISIFCSAKPLALSLQYLQELAQINGPYDLQAWSPSSITVIWPPMPQPLRMLQSFSTFCSAIFRRMAPQLSRHAILYHHCCERASGQLAKMITHEQRETWGHFGISIRIFLSAPSSENCVKDCGGNDAPFIAEIFL